jgi:hypothetical protein
LPTVFKALEEKGTRFIRGQLVLVAGAPGGGKSAFTLTVALLSRVPTMYFSADSDAFTQLVRSISIVTGWTLAESAELVLDNEVSKFKHHLEGIPIRFNYSASPSLDEMEGSIASYEEVYGDYPELIVIDNVTNVRDAASGDDDPFAGLESLMDYLHDMARKTGACVIGLHHVTGAYNDADKPVPLSGIKGQIARVPELVLTLHRKPGDGIYNPEMMCVSTVKNRSGKADPSGYGFAELEFVGESLNIRDIKRDNT